MHGMVGFGFVACIWSDVGRSDMDVHTYRSMQNLKYGDGRDLFPTALRNYSPP